MARTRIKSIGGGESGRRLPPPPPSAPATCRCFSMLYAEGEEEVRRWCEAAVGRISE